MTASTVGPWLVARNLVRSATGSIHDDERARSLGFPGGLVGGNVHLAFATTALVERFGAPWYERGVLVFKWVRPVYDTEQVRVELTERTATPADEALVDFTIAKRDATVACAGFAALATSASGAIAPWERSDAPPLPDAGDFDPLPEPVGWEYDARDVVVDAEFVERSLAGIDPNEWYRTASPWGAPVVPTTAQVVLSGYGRSDSPPEMRSGMNATIQIVQTGPMLLGRPYRRTARLAAKGAKGRYGFRTIDFENVDESGAVVTRFRWTVKWVVSPPGS